MKYPISRRTFLQTSAVVGASALLPKMTLGAPRRLQPKSYDPIARVNSASTLDFTGDDITRPHDILWDRDNYLRSRGGRPKPSERQSVVVVGGGMSGLFSAYHLLDDKPVLLEQDFRLGGNSKGEVLGDAVYSIGAAYISSPGDGTLKEALDTIGISERLIHDEAMVVNFKNQLMDGFWNGETDATQVDQFQKMFARMKDIYDNSFPDIPWTPESALSRKDLNALDNLTFDQWIKQEFGQIHPHLMEYFQLYAWSSMVGSTDELSAAQLLNFLCSELDGLYTMPGGNAPIAQALMRYLRDNLPENSLRAGSFVIDVQETANGVEVCYEDANRNLKTILCDHCVVASPKFVAKHIVTGLPQDQLKAMGALNYRGYLVGNVVLKENFKAPSYELYCLEGNVPESPRAMNPPKRAFSDLCFSGWASESQGPSVLTVYKALPFDGARQFLFAPTAHEKYKKQIESGLPGLLRALNIPESAVAGVRMTRWGHSLPVAAKGLVASGILDVASRSTGRIHFANQDNWASPCIETAESVARAAADAIRGG